MTAPAPSLAEVLEAEREESVVIIRALIDSAAVTESLLQDLLQIVANHNPDEIGAMRDHSAAAYQRAIDGTAPAENGGQYLEFWQGRFAMLNAVMARTGRPYESAAVVSLDAHRARASSVSGPVVKGEA